MNRSMMNAILRESFFEAPAIPILEKDLQEPETRSRPEFTVLATGLRVRCGSWVPRGYSESS